MNRQRNRLIIGLLIGLVAVTLPLMAHNPHDPITAVAVSPDFAQDQTVLASTDALSFKLNVYLLLRSTDGGVNWSALPGLPNNNKILAIAFSPAYAQDQTIFIAGKGGLSASTNQGTSWTLLIKPGVQSVGLSPNFATDNTLFVVTVQNAVMMSTNRGQTWTTLPAPSPLKSGLTAIAVSPNYAADNTVLLGAAADGIFRSTNQGASWVQVTTGLTLSSVTALVFSPNFASDQTAFASTYGSGVILSTNSGASWSEVNTGIADLNVTSLALSPNYTQDSTCWITTAVAGVYHSSSLGASWTPNANVVRVLSNLTLTHYQAIAPVNTASGMTLFLAMFEGLWSSANLGTSWQYTDMIPTRMIAYINLSPNFIHDHVMFETAYGGGNLWSSDGGATWSFRNNGMQLAYADASAFSPNFAVDGIAFSTSQNGLQKSSNRGKTWQLIQVLGKSVYPRAVAVSPNFAQDSTVMVGTLPHEAPAFSLPGGMHPQTSTTEGVYLSTDGGNTWQQTSLSGVTSVNAIAISPAFATDRTAFAASPNTGLYKSTDGGMTWTAIAVPSSSLALDIVKISPGYAADQTVFVAGISGQILKSTDGGTTWSLLPQTGTLRAVALELSPNYTVDQSFFVGTFQKGLVKFINGGAKQGQVTAFTDNFVTAIGLSPNFAKDRTLFAAGYHGLFMSTSGGATWTYVVTPARNEDSRNIASIGQEPPSVTYQGNWAAVTPSTVASTNSYMATSESGDVAVLSFTGSGIRWISRTGPLQGSAAIQLDGVAEGTVNLNAPLDQYQQNVWEQHGISCGSHTFTITALPQSGQSVSLDAFDVWIDTCPLMGPMD